MSASSIPPTSRRQALRVLAGAPLLPLASGLAASPSALAVASGHAPALLRVSFTAMPAPSLADAAAMATTHVGSQLVATFSDGSTQTSTLAYQALFITGDRVPDGAGGTVVAGGCYDIHNQPLIDRSVPGQERAYFSDCPDGSSLLQLPDAQVPGVKGRAVFAVVQFEYTSRNLAQAPLYGRLPSPIAVLTLDQDPATGRLSVVKYHNVDTAPARGLWITCGASLSPWNTHLSSEEYEPDATLAHNPQLQAYSQHLFGDPAVARPYDYGHLPEVTVHSDGTGTIRKHYGVGRISHELVQVMPDERTLLMGDDATHGGLFMFIADRARDLSSGTLYVARWRQTSGRGPGAADISWIKLGHARSDQIKALVDGGIRAEDIMDVRTADPEDASYTRIPYAGKVNWVRLKPGMEVAAAFLETHRYAALKGGSLGFTKMEGTTVNIKDKRAYSAMSYIHKSMLDGSGGIRVEGPSAGAVYEHILKGGQKDTSGGAIASEWVSTHMAAPAALIGQDLAAPDALGNLAHPGRIANPDNLKFSETMRTLFIGEDSGMHVNNFLWAYHVDTQVLSRVLSCPAGAESTGLHAVDELNGWTYIMSHLQHPGDWETPLHDKVRATLDPLVRANYKDRYGGAVGYLTTTGTQIRLAPAQVIKRPSSPRTPGSTKREPT